MAATLSGIALGAVAGGFLGAMIALGIPEEDARHYQQEFEAGRIIITVRAGDRIMEALEILRRNGALEANSRFGQPVDPDVIAANSVEDEATQKYDRPLKWGEPKPNNVDDEVTQKYDEPLKWGEPDLNKDSFFEQPVRPGTDEPDILDNLNFPHP
jgi:hypothetical protein